MKKALLIILTLLFPLAACEKGLDLHGNSARQEAQSASSSDQAPVIRLELKQGGKTVATVSTFKSEAKGATRFAQDEEVTFDFSRTTDDTDRKSDLSFAIDFGSGYKNVSPVSNHTYRKIGIFPTAVKVSDTEGNTATKTFNSIVQCPEGTFEPLSIEPSAIRVSPGPANNYFVYDASGAVKGGRSPYGYKWDFNGDVILDNSWHQNPSITAYSAYAGRRDVRLKVWDVGCNVSTALDLASENPEREHLEIPMADGVPGTPQGPQIPNYTFLQGKLKGISGNATPGANADFIISDLQDGGGNQPKRVHCRYNKSRGGASAPATASADFYIEAFNQYKDSGDFTGGAQEGHAGEKHGMKLSVHGIKDPTGSSMTTPATIHAAGNLEKIEYFTDGDPDTSKQQVYTRESNGCRYDLTVRIFPPGDSVPVCVQNPKFSYAVAIDGTYSCPELKTEDGFSLSAEQGAFYCEVGEVRACIPGGGGGGGGYNPPPIPL